MKVDNLVVIVTLAALLVYLWMGLRVGGARSKFGVAAPAITGHPEFERTYRVQVNTLEWLPIFLPSLWLFAAYWDPRVAAGVGVVWILGRVLYAITYTKDASKRSAGFGIQAFSTAILLFGALGAAIWRAATGA